MRFFSMRNTKKPSETSKQLIDEMLKKKQEAAPDEANRLINSLLKRKKLLGDNFEPEKDYEVIFKNEDRELRLYYPTRRTITLNSKYRDRETDRTKYRKESYFVQLPHLIFAHVKKPNRRLRPELDGNGQPIDPRGFYLVFVVGDKVEPNTMIYMPTLPNSHHDYKICQGSAGGFDFDNRVQNYWTSEFLPGEIANGPHACQYAFLGMNEFAPGNDPTEKSMANWATIKTAGEVEALLSFQSIPLSQTKFGFGLLWDGEKLYEKPPFSQADKDKILASEEDFKTTLDKMDFINRLMKNTADEEELEWLDCRYYKLDRKYWSEMEGGEKEQNWYEWRDE